MKLTFVLKLLFSQAAELVHNIFRQYIHDTLLPITMRSANRLSEFVAKKSYVLCPQLYN